MKIIEVLYQVFKMCATKQIILLIDFSVCMHVHVCVCMYRHVCVYIVVHVWKPDIESSDLP